MMRPSVFVCVILVAGVGVVVGCSDPEIHSDGAGNRGGGANNSGGGNRSGNSGAGNTAGTFVFDPPPLGGSTGSAGKGGGMDTCGIIAVFRDFTPQHPDFESFSGQDVTMGLVEATLGSDQKPVFAGKCTTKGPGTAECPFSQQMTSKERFDEWYRDTKDVNIRIEKQLPLMPDPQNPKHFVFEDTSFFPIDGEGFAKGQATPNFHFTTEIHGTFKYLGGEIFRFTGDDDVWVFVNGKLAIDVGGLHPSRDRTADFDKLAGALGIMRGQTYILDVFHAERHTLQSNFRIETTIECITNVPIP